MASSRIGSGLGLIQRRGDELVLTLPGNPAGSAAPPPLDPETIVWRNLVQSAGGTFTTSSVQVADNLIRAIKKSSINDKVVYLLPFLGVGIRAMAVPLRDRLGAGPATITGFVDADCSESTGIQGNGTTKYLDTKLRPSQLGATNNGGLIWWERNIGFGANVEPIGCYDAPGGIDSRFVIDLRSTGRRFWWSQAPGFAGENVGAVNGFYYGQRSGANRREFYLDGILRAANLNADAASGANELTIIVVGSNEGGAVTPWLGLGACSGMTDGTLSEAQVGELQTILQTSLLTPTGRG